MAKDLSSLQQEILSLKAEFDSYKKVTEEAHTLVKLGTYVHDVLTSKSIVSKEAYRVVGRTEETGPKNRSEWEKIVNPEDWPRVLEAWKKSVETKSNFECEYRVLAPDGAMIFISGTGRPHFDEQGNLIKILGTMQDVTDRKKQELIIQEQKEKLLYSAKMAALGEMASGIAHEINNPLTIILGKANQLRTWTDDQNPLSKKAVLNLTNSLKAIEEMAVRISKIIEGLKSLARPATHTQLEFIPLAHLVDDTLSICQDRFTDENIPLEIAPIPKIQARCSPVQVCQILINLLNNAFDAIADLPQKWVKVDFEVVQKNGRERLQIRVTDSGNGIPTAVADKIMRPFFTTKLAKKNTGLGLSISHTLATAQGGDLYLDRQFSNTRFVLELVAESDEKFTEKSI